MKKVDLIIHTGHMYTMDGEEESVGYQFGKSIAIDGSTIVAVEDKKVIEEEYCAEKVIDASGKLVIPGFIDGHMHTGHGVLRGISQDITGWMWRGMAPFEAARSSEAKTAGSELAIAEAIMSGTTTIGDDSSDIEGSLKFIDKVGVRGNVSVRVRSALLKPYQKDELYEFDPQMGERTLKEALDLYDKYHNKDSERIKIRFGPQGADFLDMELLQKVKKLAKERKTKIHMHLEQGTREMEQMMLRYGRRTIPMLDEMGYIDEDFIGIHLVDATDDEVETVVKRGGSMILCSCSMGVIGGGVPPAKVFQDCGGRVGLGSDQAPGNNGHNMFSEMKATAIANKIKYHNGTVMPAWKAFRMATIEGARALGIDDLTGSITPGKKADIIILDLDCPTLAPVYTVPMRNIIPNLVYAARGHEVETVIVNGKVIVEGRVPLTFDIKEIVHKAQKYADEIGPKAAELFYKIDNENCEYMKKGLL